MNIDKPLDEIIATTKRSRAPRSATGPRGGGVGPRRGGGPVGGVPRSPTGPANGGARRGPAGVVPAGGQTIPGLENVVGDKIVISNLPEDVTEPQIKVRGFCGLSCSGWGVETGSSGFGNAQLTI